MVCTMRDAGKLLDLRGGGPQEPAHAVPIFRGTAKANSRLSDVALFAQSTRSVDSLNVSNSSGSRT